MASAVTMSDGLRPWLAWTAQMQACGQPPQDIVDELAPGLQFDAEGAPVFGPGGEPVGAGGAPLDPANCVIQ